MKIIFGGFIFLTYPVSTIQSKRLVRKINRKLEKGKVINTSAASIFRGAMNKAHKHPCFASHVPNVCGVARNSRRKRFDCSARFRIWHHFPLFLARRIFIPYINGPIASLHVAQPSSAKAKYCASEYRKRDIKQHILDPAGQKGSSNRYNFFDSSEFSTTKAGGSLGAQPNCFSTLSLARKFTTGARTSKEQF